MARTRIMVIDDEALMREYVQETLVRAGHSVETTNGGEAALAVLARRSFELVVTDLKSAKNPCPCRMTHTRPGIAQMATRAA